MTDDELKSSFLDRCSANISADFDLTSDDRYGMMSALNALCDVCEVTPATDDGSEYFGSHGYDRVTSELVEAAIAFLSGVYGSRGDYGIEACHKALASEGVRLRIDHGNGQVANEFADKVREGIDAHALYPDVCLDAVERAFAA